MFVYFLRIAFRFVPLFFICWACDIFYYSLALNFIVGLYFKLPAALRFIKLCCTASCMFNVPNAISVQILHRFLIA
jgi:hypothetical protein